MGDPEVATCNREYAEEDSIRIATAEDGNTDEIRRKQIGVRDVGAVSKSRH